MVREAKPMYVKRFPSNNTIRIGYSDVEFETQIDIIKDLCKGPNQYHELSQYPTALDTVLPAFNIASCYWA